MGQKKEDAYKLRDIVHTILCDEPRMATMGNTLKEPLVPEETEVERIKKDLIKRRKAGGDKSPVTEDFFTNFEVPLKPLKTRLKEQAGKEVVDERSTYVDDPCTFKVAKGITTVLVAMRSHQHNVDMQHCACYLIRWIVAHAKGDTNVTNEMINASAEDELKAAMEAHPTHQSLQTHCKLALRALRKLAAEKAAT